MQNVYRHDHHLAVMTNWAFLGSLGLCFVISGFSAESILSGLLGFVLFVAAFASHVTINWIYQTGFSKGEVALAFVLFILSTLAFVAGWIAMPDFGPNRVTIGLLGFAAMFAAFVTYMFVNYGMRGTFEMIDEIRKL